MFFSLSFKRASSLVVLVGLVTFALAFGALSTFAPNWAAAAISTVSETTLTAALALGFAQVAMSLTGALLTRRQIREVEQVRTAIDSMAQGLCMFDAAERLVVCNAQYYKMYDLTPDDVKPGATLSEVLAKRVAKGTFSRDPQEYRKEFLTAVGLGRTIVHEVKSKGGHLLLVTNHPMKGGGWIGTHEDITERRQAEQQRTAMQHQEERRAVIENAISAFRERAENLLRTVADSAGEMRATAASLFNASGHTSNRAESAVQTSNEASSNVETAAVAADELSSSIAEIGRRLNQTTEVVRVAVDEAQVTNQGYRRAGAGRAQDRRRHQAHPQYCRTDQSLGAQRHHRGGARRRSRPRLCGGRFRGEIARRADRQGDRGYFQPDPGSAELDRQGRGSDRAHRPSHAGDRQLHLRGRRLGAATERRDRRDLAERDQRRRRRQAGRDGAERSGRRHHRDAGTRRRPCLPPRNWWKRPPPICAAKSKASSPRWRSRRPSAAAPSSPASKAFGLGGQPGIVRSTGTTSLTPPATA